MSQATLKYKLPEEEDEFLSAVNGSKYRSVIQILLQNLRAKIKYSEIPQEKKDSLEEVRQEIFNLIRENGIDGDF